MLKAIYDVRTLCNTIKLHHSVYYYHKQHRENSYKKANEELDKKIKEEFEKSKHRYGSPKITQILKAQGIKVSQKRVARRMKKLDLRSIIVKKYNHIMEIKKQMMQTRKIYQNKTLEQKNHVKSGLEILHIFTQKKQGGHIQQL